MNNCTVYYNLKSSTFFVILVLDSVYNEGIPFIDLDLVSY